jgi:pentatricopeptide repeat protein
LYVGILLPLQVSMNVDASRRLKTLIKQGCLHEAFCLLDDLHRANAPVDPSSYIQLLQGFFLHKRFAAEPRVLHSHLVEHASSIPVSVSTTLVDLYSKCGHIHDARSVFQHVTCHNVVSWTAMIAGYAHDVEHGHEALVLFGKMVLDEHVMPNSFTFVSAMNASAKLGDLHSGKVIHAHVLEHGLEANAHIANALTNMYLKCDSVEDGVQAFERICCRDLVTWTIIITGYSQKGYAEKAFEAFQQMESEGFHPDDTNFVCILSACTSTTVLLWGRQIHAILTHLYVVKNEVLENALVDMYHRCGRLEDAYQLFHKMHVKNVGTWNTMISGFAKHGLLINAFKLYESMNIPPNRITFVTILKCCAMVMDLQQGNSVYNEVVWSEVPIDVSLGNSLVDFYVNCNQLEDALRVFIKLPCKDIVSWTTMILGYGKNGYVEKASKLLMEMELEGLQPNEVTFLAIITACSLAGSLELNMQTHAKLVSSGKEMNTVVANALIDSYVKCGDIHCACYIFDRISDKDSISWNSAISGYALHGYARRSLLLAVRMGETCIKPNDVTFLGLLSAFSRVGLIDEGVYFFTQMIRESCIILKDDHFVCMVDLFARIGNLYQAAELVKCLPLGMNAVVSRALLNGCKLHEDTELAMSVIENMIALEQEDASAFTLMLNMFATSTRYGKEDVMDLLDQE